MLATINPKSARKHQRRQHEQQSAAQLEKIIQHLDGYIKTGESPAMAIKRLLGELKALGVHKPPVLVK